LNQRFSAAIVITLSIRQFLAVPPRYSARVFAFYGVGHDRIQMRLLFPALSGNPAHRVIRSVVLGDMAEVLTLSVGVEITF